MSAGKFGLLKGLGDGMAQTGNMLMVDKLDQMKQERIQSYQTKMQDKAFARDDANRAQDRAYQVEDNAVAQGNEDKRFGLLQSQFNVNTDQSTQELQLRQDQARLATRQIDQALEIGALNLQDATRVSSLYSIIADPDATPDEVTSAISTMQNLKNTDPEKYSSITIYGEENEFGVQPRTSGILSSRTGRVAPAFPQGAGDTSSQPTSVGIPQGAIDALKASPTQEMVRAFNEKYGQGSASTHIDSPQASAPDSQPSTPQVQQSPAVTSSSAGISPDQKDKLKTETNRNQRIGLAAGEDLRWVIDQFGNVVQVPGRIVLGAGGELYQLLDGPVSGVGSFLKGVFQGVSTGE